MAATTEPSSTPTPPDRADDPGGPPVEAQSLGHRHRVRRRAAEGVEKPAHLDCAAVGFRTTEGEAVPPERGTAESRRGVVVDRPRAAPGPVPEHGVEFLVHDLGEPGDPVGIVERADPVDPSEQHRLPAHQPELDGYL